VLDELTQGVGEKVFIGLLFPGSCGEGLPQGMVSAAVYTNEHGVINFHFLEYLMILERLGVEEKGF
jgi:hypothetical protein